uniref:Uncharacterized protein n=1 Tax=Anguilla anguilla TaxID=7936 RepID=A0A0E9V1R9_ANGAN
MEPSKFLCDALLLSFRF